MGSYSWALPNSARECAVEGDGAGCVYRHSPIGGLHRCRVRLGDAEHAAVDIVELEEAVCRISNRVDADGSGTFMVGEEARR